MRNLSRMDFPSFLNVSYNFFSSSFISIYWMKIFLSGRSITFLSFTLCCLVRRIEIFNSRACNILYKNTKEILKTNKSPSPRQQHWPITTEKIQHYQKKLLKKAYQLRNNNNNRLE